MSFTITEDCTLPSLGLVYSKPVNPNVKLRSMTTEEEMRRLAHTERPYKVLCDIIEDCIVGDKLGISVYDVCLGDYQYLLQKLRIATYGPDYKIIATCPHCGENNLETVDLSTMELFKLDENNPPEMSVTLPVCGKIVSLRLQTPRSLDDAAIRRKELLKSNPLVESDPTILFTLTALIDKIDGVVYDKIKLDTFIRQLSMRDTNKIMNLVGKLNRAFGYNMSLTHTCQSCGLDYGSTFRITSEFFGPTED